MNVLSLFDGMSCGQIALERAGMKVDRYFASEIDKYAIKVTQANYPDTIQLGDINNLEKWDLPKIDLIIGGSPCQGFSFAGKQLNFDDPRSKLFFKFVDAVKKFKPKYFLLENVRMKKEYQDIISNYLGVEPIVINSSLLSAQSRIRLYWTNIPNVTQPEDKKIMLKDILENGEVNVEKSQTIKSQYARNSRANFEHKGGTFHATGVRCIQVDDNENKIHWRKLMPIECERLQTVPDNYTLVPYKKRMMSNTQRYKMLGNGWTVDVIAHIFSFLPKEYKKVLDNKAE